MLKPLAIKLILFGVDEIVPIGVNDDDRVLKLLLIVVVLLGGFLFVDKLTFVVSSLIDLQRNDGGGDKVRLFDERLLGDDNDCK